MALVISGRLLTVTRLLGNLFVLFICGRLRREAGMYGIYYASLAFADLLLMGPCLIPQVCSVFILTCITPSVLRI